MNAPTTFRAYCPRCRYETEHGYFTTGGRKIPQCGACDTIHDGDNVYGRAGQHRTGLHGDGEDEL